LIKNCTKGKEKIDGATFVPRRSPLHNTPSTYAHIHLWAPHLAGSAATGNVRASGGLLATSDGVTAPSPVGASALAAEDIDIGGGAGDGSGILCHGQTSTVDFVSQTTRRCHVGRGNTYIGTPVVATPVGLPFS
jgi:hypothetical protein